MHLRAYLIGAALLAAPAAAVMASGCGSDVTVIGDDPDGTGGEGGFLFLDAGKDGATPPSDGGPTWDALDDYTDPGCPDKPPPLEEYQCDPYNQGNGDCLPGEGCYIFVDYPVEPCGQEIYGSYCGPAGGSQQGEQCSGGQDCGAGLVCVITGSGNQCVQLCNLSGPSGCPPGLVCEPIDVQGFGGCL